MPDHRLGRRKVDVRPDRVDLRDRVYRPPLVSLDAEYPGADRVRALLPRYLEDGLILDQGREGACTGFGLAAVIQYLLWRRKVDVELETGERMDTRIERVSPRMLYHLARIYDEWPGEDYDGSSCRGAMKGWHRHGACSEALWPYRVDGKARFVPPAEGWSRDAAERTLGAYYRINKDAVGDLQAAIREVGAVYVSARVHAGWNIRARKELPVLSPKGESTGGHAFAMVGYNGDGFVVQNSWGSKWGFHGFAVLRYEDWVRNGMDAWVAVMGAPVTLADGVATRCSRSLRDVADDKASFFWNSEGTGAGFEYRNPEVAPWSESRAYQHSVVLGNDGRALNRLLEAENANAGLEEIVLRRPRAWLESSSSRRVVIYAHGGLNDEEASIRRVRILAPYFRANGVYPLFLTWRTGVLESLASILEDAARGAEVDEHAGGVLDDTLDALRRRLAEARDRTIEVTAERLLGKAIWSQTKQNAQAALLEGAGGLQMVRHLAALAGEVSGLQIHLVGHSAGSILLGHMLTELSYRQVEVNTVTLFAPACSIRFALDRYALAVERGTVRKREIHLECLDAEMERADSVGPYGKSLLYLVARALETVHKTPLLGMQAAWRTDPADIEWHEASVGGIERWLEFAGSVIKPRWHGRDRERVNDGQGLVPLAHGSFDNDVMVVESTLRRVRGRQRLEFPVENLRGF